MIIAVVFIASFFTMTLYRKVRSQALLLGFATLASVFMWDLQQSYYGAMAAIDLYVVWHLWYIAKEWSAASKAVSYIASVSIIANATGYGLYMAYEPPSVYNLIAWSLTAAQLFALWIYRHGRLRAKSSVVSVLRVANHDRI